MGLNEWVADEGLSMARRVGFEECASTTSCPPDAPYLGPRRASHEASPTKKSVLCILARCE